jgi:hypothetical protein
MARASPAVFSHVNVPMEGLTAADAKNKGRTQRPPFGYAETASDQNLKIKL